ncbi:unnamed protein product [Camellia sinensis]
MLKPPVPNYVGWQGVIHPKFPLLGWKPIGPTRTQMRREQRKFHVMFLTKGGDNSKRDDQNNLIWVRKKKKEEKGESSKTEKMVDKIPKKVLLRRQLEEISKAVFSDEESGEDEVMIDGNAVVAGKLEEILVDSKEDTKEDTKSKSYAIRFGSLPANPDCNMIMALPKRFEAKPGQLEQLEGDVEDLLEPTVMMTEVREPRAGASKSIQVVKTGSREKVVL